tara:strand:- start:8 stop:301 length:294 start_codon:yes stop_codon:yes gene_type:complete
MTEKGKFLLLHIGDTQSKEVLADAFDNGIERGLILKSKVPNELLSEFKKVIKNGYFPVGCIINSDDINNLELLFHRHPHQKDSMKMPEFKKATPTLL